MDKLLWEFLDWLFGLLFLAMLFAGFLAAAWKVIVERK
jgi:hypothetical protein